MHWLLNSKNIDANGHKQLNDNLKRFGIEHSFYDIDSFRKAIVSGENFNNDIVFPFGSFSMAKTLKEYGLGKAVFMSDNISFSNLLHNWRGEMLNSDAIVGTIQNIKPFGEEFFFRPNEDSKSFQATVVSKEYFLNFRRRVFSNSDISRFWDVTPETIVVASLPKKIQAEYRVFIADKKAIAWSQYKKAGEAFISEHVDDYILDYANYIANIWSPELVYVMDIAISDNTPKVLEVNGVHASGLYTCDTQKFIMAIENLNI